MQAVEFRATVVAVAAAVSVAFLFWRHGIGSVWNGLEPLVPWLDKWHLGFLRLLNFAALAVVVSRLVVPLLAWVHVSVLALLGIERRCRCSRRYSLVA